MDPSVLSCKSAWATRFADSLDRIRLMNSNFNVEGFFFFLSRIQFCYTKETVESSRPDLSKDLQILSNVSRMINNRGIERIHIFLKDFLVTIP